MEQSININWHIQDQNNNVKKSHREPLKEAVMERVTAMMKEGFREGELIHRTVKPRRSGRGYKVILPSCKLTKP